MSEQPPFGAWPYLLPFVVFMVVSMFEPGFPTQDQDAIDTFQAAGAELSEADQYVLQQRRDLATRFFVIYGLKVLLTTGVLVYFWRSSPPV